MSATLRAGTFAYELIAIEKAGEFVTEFVTETAGTGKLMNPNSVFSPVDESLFADFGRL